MKLAAVQYLRRAGLCCCMPVRAYWMASLFILSIRLSAQVSPISGVVNSYYQVVEVIPAKSCLRLNSTAGLNYNDKVMVVQMKGAGINTSNSSVFGDTTSLNNAGNYEIATVCHTDGDSLFLVFMLLNNYTVSGKVQVVRIPHYVSATVVDTLRPAPWNNASGTGGVLAITVDNDLSLAAPVFADALGYRGGEYRLSNGDCFNFLPADNFVYNANTLTPQDGSFKGEGAADVTAAQSGGKGAPANGGGGGNNHNNGGAGGANAGSGGNGGGNSSSTGCRVPNAGLGGKALSSHGGSKIFMGGGGGAGHSNFNFPNPVGGGNGGGIVFIKAGNLVGNNQKIVANGGRGGTSIGDGASGSGAGGTLILDIANYTGSATIQAAGAQGGIANDGGNVGRCYGAGGGGGGGAIYFSGAAPALPTSVAGGLAGPEIGREASCNPIIPPDPGVNGQIIPNYTYREATVMESSYCAFLLPVTLIWFRGYYANKLPSLRWKVADPELAEKFFLEKASGTNHWTVVRAILPAAGVDTYSCEDPDAQDGNNYYRLKILGTDGSVIYSPIVSVYIGTTAQPLRIFPNPAKRQVTISGAISFSRVRLFDPAGRLLLERKNNDNRSSMTLELPPLGSGIYILRVGEQVTRLQVY